jgi:hypothetical protein
MVIVRVMHVAIMVAMLRIIIVGKIDHTIHLPYSKHLGLLAQPFG